MVPHFAAGSLQLLDDGTPDPAGTGRRTARLSQSSGPGQGRERGYQLRESVPRVLDGNAEHEFEDAAEQRAHGVDRHFPERRMLKPEVDLRFAGRGGVSLGVGPVCHMEHPRRGHHDDTVPGETVTPAEVHVVAGSRQRGVKARQVFPDVTAHQHSGRIHRKGVRTAVVLALIEFVGIDEGETLGPPAGGQSDVDQAAFAVPVQLLAAGDCD